MNLEAEALLCARASEWIYGSQEDLEGRKFCQAAMAKEGFKDFLWHDIGTDFTDLCAFAATSNQHHLLAFRGTKVLADWITDLVCAPIMFNRVFNSAPALGRIHAGFGGCLAAGIETIQHMISHGSKDKPLLITGHSLGGALAVLAATYLSATKASVPVVSRVYTFGQPRIGLQDFCNAHNRLLGGKLIRFINKQDVVPRIPLRSYDYGDCGAIIHFDSTGTPKAKSSEWQSFLSRAFLSATDLVGFALHSKQDVGDHAVTGYRELVESNQEKLAALLAEASRTETGRG